MSMSPTTASTTRALAAKPARTRLVACIAATATLLATFAAGAATYADGSTIEAQVPAGAAQNSNDITPPPAKPAL